MKLDQYEMKFLIEQLDLLAKRILSERPAAAQRIAENQVAVDLCHVISHKLERMINNEPHR